MRGLRLPILLAVSLAGTSALADDTQRPRWSGSFFAGVGSAPDYLGSDDMKLIPFVTGHIAYDRYFMAVRGKELSLGVELTPSLSLGPVVALSSGRDSGVKNPRISLLPKIDDPIDAGGFVSYAWRGLLDDQDQLTLGATYLVDVSDTHDGAMGSAAISYGRKLGSRWSLGGSVNLTYVDDSHARTFFGITPEAAARSGLPTYSLGGGIRDAGASAKLDYSLTKNWSMQLFGSYKRLLGDFKDSPVVDLEGDANQLFGAVAIGYRF